MKWVTLVLFIAIAYFQYDLWFSKGGWHDMLRLKNEVISQENQNQALTLRNTALAAEVTDLSQGEDAIAEIARVKLGFIQGNEVYYRFVNKTPAKNGS